MIARAENTTTAWWHADDPVLRFMNTVSRSIANFEHQYADGLPRLRSAAALIVGSDFGGSHGDASYESMCFLVADASSVASWQLQRESVRSRHLPDGRRLSYKGLNDRQKQKALIPFLLSANRLDGLVLAVLTDKRVQSLFQPAGRLSHGDSELATFSDWKISSIERMLRAIHFVSLLLRGLSGPGQDVLWITDQDEIAANEVRLRQLVTAFANVSSHYLPHDLRHLRVGTTASDTGRRDLEDLVAIPDLVAGALIDVIPSLVNRGALMASRIVIPAPAGLKTKARTLMDWFSDNRHALKRAILVLDEGSTKGKCRVTCLRFHGSHEITV